jgi:molybdate transport system substrate-binding protein
VKVRIAPGFDLGAALGRGRLATGDPDSVPVGRYARAALTKLGVWDKIEPRLVRAENVRAALAFVARGDAVLGIVYATDARAENKKVRIVDVFPEDSHPPIRYPIAATSTANPEAARFVEFVRSRESRRIFEKYGFQPLP